MVVVEVAAVVGHSAAAARSVLAVAATPAVVEVVAEEE